MNEQLSGALAFAAFDLVDEGDRTLPALFRGVLRGSGQLLDLLGRGFIFLNGGDDDLRHGVFSGGLNAARDQRVPMCHAGALLHHRIMRDHAWPRGQGAAAAGRAAVAQADVGDSEFIWQAGRRYLSMVVAPAAPDLDFMHAGSALRADRGRRDLAAFGVISAARVPHGRQGRAGCPTRAMGSPLRLVA